MYLNSTFLLDKDEMNAISKLIKNTNIIAERAIKEGYMSAEEIKKTRQACKIRRMALAKLIGQSIEAEKSGITL